GRLQRSGGLGRLPSGAGGDRRAGRGTGPGQRAADLPGPRRQLQLRRPAPSPARAGCRLRRAAPRTGPGDRRPARRARRPGAAGTLLHRGPLTSLPVYTGTLRFDLLLPSDSRSLKAKRSYVRPIVAALRRYEVSAAEVGALDRHGRAEIGIAVVAA